MINFIANSPSPYLVLAADKVVTFFADNWLSVVIAAIVAVFGSGGVVALIRSRGEGSKILVDAAAGAVVVQSGVIDSLQEEITRLQSQVNDQQGEISELRNHMAEVNSLRGRVRELEQDNEILKAENTKLRSEVRALRREVEQGKEL